MGADKVADRKHSTRKKYSLLPEQEIHNGWQTYEWEGKKLIYADIDLIKATTCGNLESYSKSITDSKTIEWLKSLKFSYSKIKDISEIESGGK